jgi:hypothetical protein
MTLEFVDHNTTAKLTGDRDFVVYIDEWSEGNILLTLDKDQTGTHFAPGVIVSIEELQEAVAAFARR